jgi:hypothetical protein
MTELLTSHISSHCSYRVDWSTCPRIPICWVSSPPASVGMSPSCILWVRCPMVFYLSQQRYKHTTFYVSSVTVQWESLGTVPYCWALYDRRAAVGMTAGNDMQKILHQSRFCYRVVCSTLEWNPGLCSATNSLANGTTCIINWILPIQRHLNNMGH